MIKTFNYLAALSLAGVTCAALAATQAEVDEARNECRQHKLMVESKGSFARDQDKRAWEEACGRATALMDEMSGKPPTAVASTPPAEPAAAPADHAAFEAPAPVNTSAYHYFSQENLKRQAASGSSMSAALSAPAPSVPEATPPAAEPAATEPAPSAPPTTETAAMETTPAPTDAAGQGSGPDEAVLAPSAPPEGPPQEDGVEEEEAPYTPPGP